MASNIPPHLFNSIMLYIDEGVQPGSFLSAVFSNDLLEAVARADSKAQAALVEIVIYIYNHAPTECHGSPKKVLEWINRGGEKGQKPQ